MNILITGNRKSGKSTFLNNFLRNDYLSVSELKTQVVYDIYSAKEDTFRVHDLLENEGYSFKNYSEYKSFKQEIYFCADDEEVSTLVSIGVKILPGNVCLYERHMDENPWLLLEDKKCHLAIVMLPSYGFDKLSKESFEEFVLSCRSKEEIKEVLLVTQGEECTDISESYIKTFKSIVTIKKFSSSKAEDYLWSMINGK